VIEYASAMNGDDLDETIEESFPASDAPANTPETGISIAPEEEDDAADGDDGSAALQGCPGGREQA